MKISQSLIFQFVAPLTNLAFFFSLLTIILGVTPDKFNGDNKFWQEKARQYWDLMGIGKTDIRNVMDMNAVYGGFSVALSTFPVWVMNVVPTTMANSLPAIYDRGLMGIFHDWLALHIL